MSASGLKFDMELFRQDKGSATLEFFLLAPFLLIFVAAIIDLGHALYIRQAIINASREGARYAVVFRGDDPTNPGHPLPPSSFNNPTVQQVVTDYLSNILPSGDFSVPSPTGDGYTTGITGQQVIVTVNGFKTWFFLNGMIQFFGGSPLPNPTTLTVSTVMIRE